MTNLHERIAAELGEDPFELLERVRLANIEYEKKKADCEILEHVRKQVLATVKEEHLKHFEAQGEKQPSNIRLDDLARSSETYKTFLGALHDARRTLAERQAEYWALRDRLDLMKEALKFARAEAYLQPA